MKHLEGMGDEEVAGLNIPTGVPLLYRLNASLRPLERRYLGDPEAIANAQVAVVAQGQAAAVSA